jgi:hypothetical protein
VEAFFYILLGTLGVMAILFMLGAARLASEADRQSEAIGRALRRSKEESEAQDKAIGNTAGPRKVKPV